MAAINAPIPGCAVTAAAVAAVESLAAVAACVEVTAPAAEAACVVSAAAVPAVAALVAAPLAGKPQVTQASAGSFQTFAPVELPAALFVALPLALLVELVLSLSAALPATSEANTFPVWAAWFARLPVDCTGG